MKKILMGAAALLFAGVLAGCNQLTQYTLSEQEVNDYLQKHNDWDILPALWLRQPLRGKDGASR